MDEKNPTYCYAQTIRACLGRLPRGSGMGIIVTEPTARDLLDSRLCEQFGYEPAGAFLNPDGPRRKDLGNGFCEIWVQLKGGIENA
jgi:hypothetical protein